MAESQLSGRIINLIQKIPRGRVATYGQLAAMAGNPRGARLVSWLLHSSSRKHGLPWHRVINSRGGVSLPPGSGGREQMKRLKSEGVLPGPNQRYDLKKYGWKKALHRHSPPTA